MAFLDGVLPGVVEGGLGTLEIVLDLLRAEDATEGGLSPPATDERPDRLDIDESGLAVASVGASLDKGLILCAGQKSPFPGSQAKYCTLKMYHYKPFKHKIISSPSEITILTLAHYRHSCPFLCYFLSVLVQRIHLV